METEGKLLHNEESFHKHKSPEEHASSLPPHLKDPERSWRRCHSGLRSKQSYDNQEEKPGEGQRNSGRFGRGFANESSYDGRRRERQLYDPREKASKSNSQVFTQGKINGRNSADAHVKGDRGPRSTPNSARRPRPDHTSMSHFEVKMADFPELGGLPAARPDVLLVQKDSWRNTPSPVSPRIPRSPWKPSKEDPPSSDPRVTPTENNSDSPDIAPAGTSWANVASQPPKKPSRETTTRDNQQEDHNSLQEEGNMGKKKRRRKKKKPKDSNEDAEDEDEECLTHQEPPKFEDEEEFPGLTASGFCEVTSSSYASKLGKKENPKDQHLSTDQLKEKSSLKSQQEMIKKPQVAQKTSGKKSKAPVQLDFGNMLAVLEETQKSQKTKQDVKSVISVGGGLPFIPKQPPVQKKAPWQQEKIAHNPLDSTSPLVKKGKQREVPKAKKPTPLKKIILKEREERKQRRLLEEQGLLPETEAVQATDAAEEEQIAENSADEETDTVIQEEEEESHVDEAHKDNTESHKEEVVEQQSTQTVTDSIPKPKIHSRKFRDYCSQMLSKEVDECVTTLLKELVRFQDRLHQKDPMKARMKRRIVMGLREVLKHLKLRKVKCVVISPNCERVQSKGGLDEALHTIINTCREQEVPFVFALSRKALGRCLNKVVPVSLVGIFNYDGAQDHYHKMIELSSEARKAYEVMVCSLEQAEHEEGEDWPAANIDEGQDIDTQSCTGGSDPSPAPPDEPEYIKLWKTLLKDCNHKVLDFQSKLVNPESHVVDGEVEPS